MNVGTIQIKFRQRLNKISSNDYDNIECWQIVEAYNKAQIEWCRRQLHGNNMYKEGDEMSKRRIDDLQILLTTQTLVGTTFNDFFQSNNWPNNYLEYKRVSAYATDDCCKDPRSMTVYLAEEANIDLLMRDELKRPDFNWGETYCTLVRDTIKIFKRKFNIVNPSLTFYRKPLNIEILGCVDPYTETQSLVDVIPEFKDDIVEVIIDEAVAIVAGDIDSVNQSIRGTQSAEKNN